MLHLESMCASAVNLETGRGSVENIQLNGLKEVKIVDRKVRRRQKRNDT